MGLGGRHLGLACQVLERHAPSRACQHLEQLAADFHALYATRPARGFVVCGIEGKAGVVQESGGVGHGGIVTGEKGLESFKGFSL